MTKNLFILIFLWVFASNAYSQDLESNRNEQDTLYSGFQLSLFPFVGTNGSLSGKTVNSNSINIIGGYSMGTSGFEVGGYFNIDRAYVHGAQFAGLFNYAGGEVTGFQGAGMVNIAGGPSRAWQMAGYANINLDSAAFPQLAGFANVNLGTSRGAHLAGLGNFHQKEFKGAALAGMINVDLKKSSGTLMAGMANFQLGDFRGFQGSGMANINIGKMEGVQISSLLNVSGKLHGAQIGLINIADSVSGVQVGLLSFSKNGYHKIEVSADEIFYTNLAFRTGSSHAFYNIFTVGIMPQSHEPVWTNGYGIGSSPRLYKNLFLNTDITANNVLKGRYPEEFQLLTKWYLGLEYQITRKISITAGATLNSYLTKNTYQDYPDIFRYNTPHFILDRDYSYRDLNHKMWIGWKAGIRFL